MRGRATAWLVTAVTLAVTGSACIGTSPEEQDREDQGESRDGDEEHRPGQPCLVCHSADYHPGDRVFVLAGTVYRSAMDPDDQGLADAEILVIDDAGHEFAARTNSVGNFMVEVTAGVSSPEQLERGRFQIPWDLVFPVSVAVGYRGEDKSMETLIWRDGSCAGCHRTSQTGADHVEKVWFAEGLP